MTLRFVFSLVLIANIFGLKVNAQNHDLIKSDTSVYVINLGLVDVEYSDSTRTSEFNNFKDNYNKSSYREELVFDVNRFALISYIQEKIYTRILIDSDKDSVKTFVYNDQNVFLSVCHKKELFENPNNQETTRFQKFSNQDYKIIKVDSLINLFGFNCNRFAWVDSNGTEFANSLVTNTIPEMHQFSLYPIGKLASGFTLRTEMNMGISKLILGAKDINLDDSKRSMLENHQYNQRISCESLFSMTDIRKMK